MFYVCFVLGLSGTRDLSTPIYVCIGKVEGLEVGLTLGLVNNDGYMKLSLLNSSCDVNNITIDLDGGASLLYQG